MISHNPEATLQMGVELARDLVPGDVVVLTGDLGAGKTVFTAGLATGLGYDGPVTSPTFTLVHEYAGRIPLLHLDLYRLESAVDVFGLGLEERIADSVLVVEWGERFPATVPAANIVVTITFGDASEVREIAIARVERQDAAGPSAPIATTSSTGPPPSSPSRPRGAILGLDTSTDHVVVALGRDGELVASSTTRTDRTHAEVLIPVVDSVLVEAGVTAAELGAVVVGIGPGWFTGLRVGVVTAKTLARVLDVPLLVVSTLEVVAWPWRDASRVVVPVLDARRREVFWARFEGGARRGEDRVSAPQVVREYLTGDELVVGAGAGLVGADPVGVDGPIDPAALIAGGAPVETATVVPNYLRRTDAELAASA